MGGGALGIADLHLAGAPEVIACGHVDALSEQHVGTDGEVAAEALAPVVEPAHRGRHAQRGVADTFGGTNLQVEGNAVEVVVVCLELSAEVTCDGRDAQVIVLVVVIQTEVDPDGERVVAADIGSDELGGDAAAELIGQGVGEGAADGDVAGGEGAEFLIVGGRLLHAAVVHVLGGDTPCAPVAGSLHEGGTGRLGPFHIGHEVEVDGAVADIVDECRVLEDEGGIVIDERDVVAAECCRMGTYWQPQEVVGRLALLGAERGEWRVKHEDYQTQAEGQQPMPLQPLCMADKPMLFSHFSPNRSQNYEIFLNIATFLRYYCFTFLFFYYLCTYFLVYNGRIAFLLWK